MTNNEMRAELDRIKSLVSDDDGYHGDLCNALVSATPWLLELARDGLRWRDRDEKLRLLGNIVTGLSEPLECGHRLEDWCDRCMTCGSCHDEQHQAKKGGVK